MSICQYNCMFFQLMACSLAHWQVCSVTQTADLVCNDSADFLYFVIWQ